jgi:hypothetical protein
MPARLSYAAFGLFVCLIVVTNTGCVASNGPYLGWAGIPIPVSPYFQDRLEDKQWEHERYERSPVLGPLTADGPDIGMDPPSDDQVFRKLLEIKQVEGGWPFLHTIQLNDVHITKEKIADYVDPPRVYPLVGPAQLHHVHYKCTVYYREKVRVGWPIPHTLTDDDAVEVIYIDKNHLHMVGNVDTGKGAEF